MVNLYPLEPLDVHWPMTSTVMLSYPHLDNILRELHLSPRISRTQATLQAVGGQ